jgi:transcriptional regulator with XRE-family HTH domain
MHYSREPDSQTKDYYHNLIVSLAKLRHEQGMTQADLEHELGVSESLVAKWESHQRLPSAHSIMSWCNALGVTLTLTKKE